MKAEEKERMRQGITEAFDFVRFLIKNPKMLKKVKNGAEIVILPQGVCWSSLPRGGRKTQFFTAETVYHAF